MTTNLVHNAIVHNLPYRGTVWLTTSAEADTVVLTVENTGEELTPQLVSTLVEPFQRGTERIRNDHAGVGLGLAIVTTIAHAHDGSLTLTPGQLGGSASRCVSRPPRPAWRLKDQIFAAASGERPSGQPATQAASTCAFTSVCHSLFLT